MNTVYLEKESRRVSLAFQLVDAYSDSVITEAVEVYLTGIVQRPIHTDEGYIIYMDLPAGEYEVKASGRYFDFFESLSLDTTTFNALTGPHVIQMRPRVDYPFKADATLVRGIVRDQDGVPVAGARVEVVNGTDFAITDALGRCVFFFEPATESIDLTLNITASGFQSETVAMVVPVGETTSFNTTLVNLSAPNRAVLSGVIRDGYGNPISQARVGFQGTDISTITDARGNYTISCVLQDASQSMTIELNRDGYVNAIVSRVLTAGQNTVFNHTMSFLPSWETIGFFVATRTTNYHVLNDVLVEVLEKNWACYTSGSDGRVRFFDNSVIEGGENVTLRMSKPGYVTRIEHVTLRSDRWTDLTYRLSSG